MVAMLLLSQLIRATRSLWFSSIRPSADVSALVRYLCRSVRGPLLLLPGHTVAVQIIIPPQLFARHGSCQHSGSVKSCLLGSKYACAKPDS